jgi:hypothetical protein
VTGIHSTPLSLTETAGKIEYEHIEENVLHSVKSRMNKPVTKRRLLSIVVIKPKTLLSKSVNDGKGKDKEVLKGI